jgi:hypothetical protein
MNKFIINKRIVKEYLISLGYDVKGIINIDSFSNSYGIKSAISVIFSIKYDKHKFDYLLIDIVDIEKHQLYTSRKNKIDSL